MRAEEPLAAGWPRGQCWNGAASGLQSVTKGKVTMEIKDGSISWKAGLLNT